MRRWFWTGVAVALLIAAALVATSGGTGEATGPPRIAFGADTCDRCRMVITDERFAAGYRTENGHYRLFDDLGEMSIFMQDFEEPLSELWVRDYEQEKWIRAETAHYVHAVDLHSPMGFNFAAFESKKAAERMAERLTDATVHDWQALLLRPGNPAHPHHAH